MKAYIYLYPIKQYFDDCVADNLKLSKDKNVNNNFRRINDIINARYREKGYVIHWLMFSRKDDINKPDLSTITDYIRILKEDVILVAGISYEKHIAEFVYPDPEFILKQIPELTELIVGGFHQWDCVSKLAQHAYQKGVSTLVDEDTTNLFFERTRIPLIRKETTLESLGLEGLKIGLFRKMREDKPWFIQV